MSKDKVNSVRLKFFKSGIWQDFVGILICNGYEVTCKETGDDIVITWGDKESED